MVATLQDLKGDFITLFLLYRVIRCHTYWNIKSGCESEWPLLLFICLCVVTKWSPNWASLMVGGTGCGGEVGVMLVPLSMPNEHMREVMWSGLSDRPLFFFFFPAEVKQIYKRPMLRLQTDRETNWETVNTRAEDQWTLFYLQISPELYNYFIPRKKMGLHSVEELVRCCLEKHVGWRQWGVRWFYKMVWQVKEMFSVLDEWALSKKKGCVTFESDWVWQSNSSWKLLKPQIRDRMMFLTKSDLKTRPAENWSQFWKTQVFVIPIAIFKNK